MHRPLLFIVTVASAGCGVDYGLGDVEFGTGGGKDPGETPESSAILESQGCADAVLADEVLVDETCAHEEVTGTLDAMVEWSIREFNAYGIYNQVVMAPVVGQLDDDNADGIVDVHDIPDIVVIADDEGEYSHKKGVLRIIPGDGSRSGAAMLRADYVTDSSVYQVYPYRYSNVALGDIDSDGEPEIVFIAQVLEDSNPDTGEVILDTGPPDTAPPSEPGDSGGAGDTGEEAFPIDPVLPDPETPDGSSICQVVAVDPSGAVEWIAHDLLLTCGGHAPALGDLEGDGAVEVIVGDAAISGADGALLWEGGAGKGAYATHPEVGYHTVINDLDGDGLQEVLTGRTLYSATGDVLCGFTDPERDGFAAVADLDLDGVGEVVSIGGGIGRIIEMDCSVVTTFSLAGGGNGGPPTIADYDTDGIPEIGVAEAETYTVYEADGTVSWSTRVDDASSHVTGSVVFDFEGDGRPEVVYADETRLWVFDGLTGAVRLEDTNHASRTLHEFPTVADVDGDGQTEIIVPCGGGHAGENQNGLYVLGSETGAWVGSRQVWNQHAYSITNVEDDLTIPSRPASNWPTYNNFRSGDLMPTSAGGASDGVPLGKVCLDECEFGRVVVHIRLGNSGAAGMRYGVPISLYAEDIAGYRTFIETVWVPEVVDPGLTSPTLRVEIDQGWIEGQHLVVVADDQAGIGWVPECNEDNNELRFDLEEVSCGG